MGIPFPRDGFHDFSLAAKSKGGTLPDAIFDREGYFDRFLAHAG